MIQMGTEIFINQH